VREVRKKWQIATEAIKLVSVFQKLVAISVKQDRTESSNKVMSSLHARFQVMKLLGEESKRFLFPSGKG
jgi:hypothetical protein